jgi:hypothetical protein
MSLLLTQQDDIAGVLEANSIGSFAPGFSSTEGFIGELWNAGAIVLTRAPEWVTSNCCMIETLPLADICAIGWQAAKNCGRAYTNKVATSRKHAANMLPGKWLALPSPEH